MANAIKQFRYYGNGGGEKNEPNEEYVMNKWVNGELFTDYFPIRQLGIQSLPGTKFYLNNAEDPIIIGHTGLYELELENGVEISALNFDYNSLHIFDTEGSQGYLLVDIVYDNREA